MSYVKTMVYKNEHGFFITPPGEKVWVRYCIKRGLTVLDSDPSIEVDVFMTPNPMCQNGLVRTQATTREIIGDIRQAKT